LENVKGRYLLRDTGVDGTSIMKLILKKWGVRYALDSTGSG
jgi:hypothetical protein